jgi:YfiR/HmsC-like
MAICVRRVPWSDGCFCLTGKPRMHDCSVAMVWRAMVWRSGVWRSGIGRRCGALLRLASAGVGLILGAPLIDGQQSASVEYQDKATFLSQFPNFIEWPEGTFPAAKSSFLICVFGDFSFGTSLAEATHSETFHGRKVEVRWVRKIAEIRGCQILFVSRSETQRYTQVLGATANAQVLTVGETADFLKAGGAVCFSFDGETLQFEVNLAAASGAGLKMSSRLLALARRVVNVPEPTKG